MTRVRNAICISDARLRDQEHVLQTVLEVLEARGRIPPLDIP